LENLSWWKGLIKVTEDDWMMLLAMKEGRDKEILNLCKSIVLEHLATYQTLVDSGVDSKGLLIMMNHNFPALFDNVISQKIKDEL
jgi:hypothetical protein